MFFRISSIFFNLTLAFAARPMITDDARVVDRNSCQLEAWSVSSKALGEYWAIPACNIFFNTEMSLGVMGNNSRLKDNMQGSNDSNFIIGFKKVFHDLETKGYSYGLALGNFLFSQDSHEYYVYAPISGAFFNNTLLIHSNLGYKFRYKENRPHIYYLGLGFERQITQYLWILGESFYERLDRAKFQVGIRIWIVKDRIQLDGTYGNAFMGNQSWVSLGLRLLSPEMF